MMFLSIASEGVGDNGQQGYPSRRLGGRRMKHSEPTSTQHALAFRRSSGNREVTSDHTQLRIHDTALGASRWRPSWRARSLPEREMYHVSSKDTPYGCSKKPSFPDRPPRCSESSGVKGAPPLQIWICAERMVFPGWGLDCRSADCKRHSGRARHAHWPLHCRRLFINSETRMAESDWLFSTHLLASVFEALSLLDCPLDSRPTVVLPSYRVLYTTPPWSASAARRASCPPNCGTASPSWTTTNLHLPRSSHPLTATAAPAWLIDSSNSGLLGQWCFYQVFKNHWPKALVRRAWNLFLETASSRVWSCHPNRIISP